MEKPAAFVALLLYWTTMVCTPGVAFQVKDATPFTVGTEPVQPFPSTKKVTEPAPKAGPSTASRVMGPEVGVGVNRRATGTDALVISGRA
jgi:hypothetical protein